MYGFLPAAQGTWRSIIKHGASKAFVRYAETAVPKITVITRRSSWRHLMASKHLRGDLSLPGPLLKSP
jgi:acetyl-CoA carboxylase carboxyltransferase component